MPKLHASGAVTHDVAEVATPAASAPAEEEIHTVALDDAGAADDSPQPKKAAPAKKAPAKKAAK